MTNHPNRNWRRRMHDACAAYLARWTWRPGSQRMISDDALRGLMTQSYQAGYTERHERDRKPQSSQS